MDFTSLQTILKQRLEDYEKNPQESLKLKGIEYTKKWNEAVGFFRIRINKDRRKENLPEVSFIQVRQKLIGVKEIDHLRWFYEQCLKYSYTRDKKTKKRNTFSRCFWGALQVKNK